jgi:hypothetical protein
MIVVGFTGTQAGMSIGQMGALGATLDYLATLPNPDGVRIFVHGDCIGADAEAHALVCALNNWQIEIRPGDNDHKRAFCQGASHIYKPAANLYRNRAIVKQCEFVIAAPSGLVERVRSGTWMTVRETRKAHKAHRILHVDGQIVDVRYPEVKADSSHV